MTIGDSIHPEFVRALRKLAAQGVSHAEARRLLVPVSERLGVPRPSYPTVQRVMTRERALARRRREARERALASLLAGRVKGIVP